MALTDVIVGIHHIIHSIYHHWIHHRSHHQSHHMLRHSPGRPATTLIESPNPPGAAPADDAGLVSCTVSTAGWVAGVAGEVTGGSRWQTRSTAAAAFRAYM